MPSGEPLPHLTAPSTRQQADPVASEMEQGELCKVPSVTYTVCGKPRPNMLRGVQRLRQALG